MVPGTVACTKNKKKIPENNDRKDIDELCQNYEDMDETGREKLREVTNKIQDIWKTVSEKHRV